MESGFWRWAAQRIISWWSPDAILVSTARSVAASATGCAASGMAGSVVIVVGASEAILDAIEFEMGTTSARKRHRTGDQRPPRIESWVH